MTSYIRKAAVALSMALSSMVGMAQSNADEFIKAIEAADITLSPSTNMEELKSQYAKNKEQWNAALNWLSTNNLKTMSAGRVKIEGTNLVASIEDTQNANLESRSSESHYHHIDLQIVIRGHEGFALLDHATSVANTKWREDVVHYNFDPDRLQMLVGKPNDMFLFFPSDWHIAKVQTPFADQTLRVIVIKLDYVE